MRKEILSNILFLLESSSDSKPPFMPSVQLVYSAVWDSIATSAHKYYREHYADTFCTFIISYSMAFSNNHVAHVLTKRHAG